MNNCNFESSPYVACGASDTVISLFLYDEVPMFVQMFLYGYVQIFVQTHTAERGRPQTLVWTPVQSLVESLVHELAAFTAFVGPLQLSSQRLSHQILLKVHALVRLHGGSCVGRLALQHPDPLLQL